MAFQKKTLKDLIDNPHSVRADDLEDSSQEMPGEDQMPSDEEATEPASEEMNEDEMTEPEHQKSDDSEVDQDLLAALKKLKNPEMDASDQEMNEDIVSDDEAPMELRKAAIQKIRQKYLGR